MRPTLLLAFTFAVCGCHAGAGKRGAADPPVPGVLATSHGTLASGGVSATRHAFEERVYDYRIEVDPTELARLDAEPARHDDEARYIPARVHIDGKDLGRVGLRYKGAHGTFRTCLSSTGRAAPYAPDPAAACPPRAKFPYKLAFDEYDRDRRYCGLRKINLHNLIRDPSKLHEYLAFRLFRQMGIAAAHSSFARVTVNGEWKGLYAVTEDMGDERFTADRWPADPHGNLYKQVWPPLITGADDPRLRRALATNKKTATPASHQALLAFGADLRAAGDDPRRAAAALERWSDPEWLARYLVVDTALRNVDGITKRWCLADNDQVCLPNNFFWYQTRDNRFLLLPWDLDYTWRVKVRQNRLPPWDLPIPNPAVASCAERIVMDGSRHEPAACDPLFRGMNALRPLYLRAVQQLLASPAFQVARLHADVDRLVALIAPVVAADTTIPTSGSKEWRGQIALLKQDIAFLRTRMEAVAAGQPFRPFPPAGPWEYTPTPPVAATGQGNRQ
jgi:spore coat protein H